jgi:hypothetical protein
MPLGAAVLAAVVLAAALSPAAAADTPASAPSPAAATAPAAALSPELASQLESATYVYISSTRKDGSLSRRAEIWFMFADGAVWVASAPTTWRVKRIRWGRPAATIWVGTSDGPSFRARGEIVADPKRYDQLCERFAVKYRDRWARWESSFREGLRSGERVLIRYTPIPS